MRAKLKKQIWRSHSLLITAPSIAALAVAAASLGLFQLLEWATLDQFFRWRQQESVDERIVVVTVDEKDIQKAGQWPISDALLAKLIDNLNKQQPRAIGLALYRDLPVEPGHQRLVKLFESTPNIIGVEKIVRNVVSPPPSLDKFDRVGMADLVLDADGKVRRALLSVRTETGKTKLSLGTKLALMYLEKENIQLQTLNPKTKHVQLGKAVFRPLGTNEGGYVSVDAGGYQILLNWRGTLKNFRTVSMTGVLENKIPPNLFRDRIAIVGANSTSLNDFFLTPYSSNWFSIPQRSPSMVIHANLASQILSSALEGRPFLRAVRKAVEVLWTLVWAAIGTLLTSTLLVIQPFRNNFLLAAIIYGATIFLTGGSLIASSYVIFLASWWLPLWPALMALVGSSIATAIYHSWHFQKLANFDSLTQTANRRYFQEYIDRKWQLTARKSQYLSLIICDVDCFKQYNDTYGHQAGDECLQQIAKAICSAADRSGLVARYGGEEFAVILPNADSETALQVAAKITMMVKSLQITHVNSKPIDRVTLSCGVATVMPNFKSSPAQLIASADKAVYEAKRQGRDRVKLAS